MSVSVEEFLQSYGVETDFLEHGDWEKHKCISKHPSKKSGKMVYAYKSSGFSKKISENIIENYSNGKVPDEYNPKFGTYDYPGEGKRYTYKGMLLSGNYEEARRAAWAYDIAQSQSRVEAIKERDRELNSVTGRINNAKNWIKEQAGNVSDWASDTVDNGRNFVSDLLESAADKIRPKKK